MPRFSITTLLFTIAFIAVIAAWMNDRVNHQREIDALKARAEFDSLSKDLLHPDAEIRSAAVLALKRIGNESCFGPLIYALSDSDDNVRDESLSALEELTEKSFRLNLINQNLHDGERPIETFWQEPRPWIQWHEEKFADDHFGYMRMYRTSNQKLRSPWPRGTKHQLQDAG